MNKLGEYIKRVREEKGMSLREFANICDLSHTHIDSIEKGVDFRTGKKVKPTVETLQKIAKGINVDPIVLFRLSVGEDIWDKTMEEVDKLTNDDIILLVSKRLGYGDDLTEYDLEKVKLAIQIALTTNR